MGFDKEQIKNYISESKHVILATVDNEKGEAFPAVRTLGGFANDGLTIYFSTPKDSPKVAQLIDNPNVTAFFQHEGQELTDFKNVSVIGKAALLVDEEEFDQAVEILGKRNPRILERIKDGGKEKTAVFRIVPKKIRSLDFSRGHGPKSVEFYEVGACCAKAKEAAAVGCKN